MIQHGMIEENAEAAEIFHEMEKYVQKCKLKLQETILLEKNKGRQLGKLEFAAYDEKKKKEKLLIYLALAKPALPGQFVLLVSSQSKENASKYFCLFQCAAQNKSNNF